MSVIDWVLLSAIALAAGAAVAVMIRRRKQGKSCSCGGDCSRCNGCAKR